MALRDNLMSWWELNETSGTRADSHGSNDASDVNTVGYGTGKQGNAGDFEYANKECLKVAGGLIGGKSQISVAAWVNPESHDTYGDHIIGEYQSIGNQRCFSFYRNNESPHNGKLWLDISSSGATGAGVFQQWASDSVQLTSLATWYHVVVTVDLDTETVKMYVNGSEVACSKVSGTTIGATFYNGTADFLIGSQKEDPTYNYWDGLLDEVGLWDKVLSASEVSSLYNSGNGLSYADTASAAAVGYKNLLTLGAG